jgi:hypothetical protein
MALSPKLCMHSSCPPCVPCPSHSLWHHHSSYMTRISVMKILSSFLPIHPSSVHIFSSPPCSRPDSLWGSSSLLSTEYRGYWVRYPMRWFLNLPNPSALSLVSTTEKLLGRNSSGFGQESREYGRGDPSRWPRGTFYAQKLVLTSPTSGGRSVGIVRSWTQATEFFRNPSGRTRPWGLLSP